MVKVHIEDEKETSPKSPYSSPSSSRTSSSVSLSSVSSDLPAEETVLDRIIALKDIIPPTTRYNISKKASKTASVLWRTGRFLGNVAWVLSTSAIMLGIPLVLAVEGEHMIVQQEKETLAQQEGQQLLGSPLLPESTRQSQQPVTPPGF